MAKVKFMTFNIQHGAGIDGFVNLDRQAADMLSFIPDVIVLQEVDIFVARSDRENQLQKLRNILKMPYSAMGTNIAHKEGYFGNAILSKYPIVNLVNYILPKIEKSTEQRGLLCTTLNIDDENVDFLTTHLSTTESERILASRRIAEIIREFPKGSKIVLAGDFNTGMRPIEPGKYEHQEQDVYEELEVIKKELSIVENNQKTYPSDYPVAEIDYIFHSKNIKLLSSKTVETTNSDHFGLFAEFSI